MISEWIEVNIGSIGRVVTGRTPSKDDSDHWGDRMPFLTPTDMDGRRTVSSTARGLSDKGISAFERIVIPHGVAVSCIGWQMGKTILVQQPTVTNQQINSIITHPDIVDDLFLYYSLSTRRDEIFHLGSGGSRTPILNKSSFERLTLWLPPLPEQRRIAAVLGALDDKIELNRQMNRTLEAMAQALFQRWFVDFDDHADFQDSGTELGQVPKGWAVRPLDKIAHFLNGTACQKYPPTNGEEILPVIKIRELRNGFTENTDQVNLTIPKKYIIEDGDVLFSWSGSLLVKLWAGGRGALNQHVFKVSSKQFPKWFYYLWSKHHLDEFQRIAASKATTMGHIKRRHLSEALVAVPTPEELQMMTEIMTPLLQRQLANDLQSRTLAELRDTLLPKLISGEIRVPEAEDQIEDDL